MASAHKQKSSTATAPSGGHMHLISPGTWVKACVVTYRAAKPRAAPKPAVSDSTSGAIWSIVGSIVCQSVRCVRATASSCPRRIFLPDDIKLAKVRAGANYYAYFRVNPIGTLEVLRGRVAAQ